MNNQKNVASQLKELVGLPRSCASLDDMIRNLPVAAFLIDCDHRVRIWNTEMARISGVSADIVEGTRHAWRAFYPTPRPLLADLIIDQYLSGESDGATVKHGIQRHYSGKQRLLDQIPGAFEIEDFIPAFNGRGCWLYCTVAPLYCETGKLMGALEIIEDASVRHQTDDLMNLAFQKVYEQHQEVQSLNNLLLEENRVAAYVLSKIVEKIVPDTQLIEHTVLPTGTFSGDIVLAGTTPSGKLNVVLADAIGHGLPAAFSLMPIFPVFDAMTRKNFLIGHILYEMNRTLKNVMPADRFIAASGITLDTQRGVCHVWSGGNPKALIRSGRTLSAVDSSHLALGLNDLDAHDEFTPEAIEVNSEDRIILFTDGLLEAWQDGVEASAGPLEGFILSCPPEQIFSRVMAELERSHRHDDASLVVVRVP